MPSAHPIAHPSPFSPTSHSFARPPPICSHFAPCASWQLLTSHHSSNRRPNFSHNCSHLTHGSWLTQVLANCLFHPGSLDRFCLCPCTRASNSNSLSMSEPPARRAREALDAFNAAQSHEKQTTFRLNKAGQSGKNTPQDDTARSEKNRTKAKQRMADEASRAVQGLADR